MIPSINVGRLILSFLLASALWFVANYESDLEKEVEIPINYLNLPKELVISNKPYLPVYVKLRIKGTRSQVSSVLKTNAAINIDLKGESTGTSSHKISPESASLPRNVQIVRISPREVNLDIDTILEKFVRVNPDLGQPAQGYKMDDPAKVIPSAVRIRGPQKVIRDISEVVTVPIEVEKEKSTFSLDVGLVSPDSRVEFTESETVKVTVNIVETSVEKVFRNLEVKILNASKEDSYSLKNNTADIKFYGPRSLINSLHSEDITIYADVRSAGKIEEGGRKTMRLESKYPHTEKIQLIDISPEKTVMTRQKTTKEEEGK